jgi:hypothetical protein
MATVTLIVGQNRAVFGLMLRRGVPVEITDDRLDYFRKNPEYAVSDEAPAEPASSDGEKAEPAEGTESAEAAEAADGAGEGTDPEPETAAAGTTFTTADLPEDAPPARRSRK